MRPPTSSDLESMVIVAMRRNDWSAVAHLQPQLDALDQPKTTVPVLSAALYYAEQGLRVFPLQPHLKTPHRGTRGCKEASTERERIIAWWERWPDSNVAIATGHLVDVIDIDGPIGVTSWARMKNLPATIGVVSTPRPGGNHLYITATGKGNKAAIAPGVDYRGLGGYVVSPPSINENGIRYTWRRPLKMSAVEAVA